MPTPTPSDLLLDNASEPTLSADDVSNWGDLIDAEPLADLGINSDRSVADSSDRARRNRNRAKAILILMGL